MAFQSGLFPKSIILTVPPVFLAPSLFIPKLPSYISNFSTSPTTFFRKRRHGNKERGVSAVRRTGLRYPVGMSNRPLPEPVLDPEKRSKITTDESHGLWGFFNKDKKLLTEPLEESQHGMYSCPITARSMEAYTRFLRARMDGERATKQVLGRYSCLVVDLLSGKEQTCHRNCRESTLERWGRGRRS